MLTNQIIGAGQNVASHTPLPGAPIDLNNIPTPISEIKAPAALTAFAITPSDDAQAPHILQKDRPPLEIPKRAELSVAVPDTIPDAEPESIFKAVTTPSDT